MIEQIISQVPFYAVGWAVLHSIWQGLFIGILFWILNKALKAKASVNYWVATAGLYLVFACFVWTFVLLLNREQAPIEMEDINGNWPVMIVNENLKILPDTMGWFDQLYAFLNEHLKEIVLVWSVGVLLFMIRFLGGIFFVRYLRKFHEILPEEWQKQAIRISRQLNVKRPLVVAESVLVEVPMVIGYFKPLILFPVGLVNALSIAEVEAILAHEIAHIRRKDYLLNLINTFIEILLYFNPAVWWFSNWIKKEREYCCDDIAISITGSPLLYAKALVRIQETQKTEQTKIIAMSLFKNKKTLLRRIKRLLNQNHYKSTVMEKLSITLLLALSIFLISMHADKEKVTESPVSDPTMITKDLQSMEDKGSPKAKELKEVNTKITRDQQNLIPLKVEKDTLPKGKTDLKVTRDGEVVEAKIEDGKIKYLKIDGEEIPKQQFPEYEQFLEELIADIPEPPAPPLPPAPEAPIAPPLPPNPPAVDELPIPSAPPAPKANNQSYIKTQKGEDGNTTIIFKNWNGEKIKFTVDDVLSFEGGRHAVIGDQEGEVTIYLDDLLVDQNALESEIFKELDEKQLALSETLRESLRFEHAFDSLDFQVHEIELKRKMEELEKELSEKLKAIEINTQKLEEFGAEMEEFHRRNEKKLKAIEEELIKDDLINDNEYYQLKISPEGLWINEVQQPNEIYKKYKSFFKEISDRRNVETWVIEGDRLEKE